MMTKERSTQRTPHPKGRYFYMFYMFQYNVLQAEFNRFLKYGILSLKVKELEQKTQITHPF